MKFPAPALMFVLFLTSCEKKSAYEGEIFDAHLHTRDTTRIQSELEKYRITRGAISGSWQMIEKYRAQSKPGLLLFGLMFPCPNGKIPYGGPNCFEDGKEYPDVSWVRQQLVGKKIDFLGELLNEYYGISSSDSSMHPYYELAQEFNIPLAMHTGLAGDDHGCPNFNPAMGDPKLLEPVLIKYPRLRVWLMHAGGAYYSKGTQYILSTYPQVYVDISVIANTDIVPKQAFQSYMKSLVDAGLEDQLMFGSDDGDLTQMISAVNELDFLTAQQKEKIFHGNAVTFFGASKENRTASFTRR